MATATDEVTVDLAAADAAAAKKAGKDSKTAPDTPTVIVDPGVTAAKPAAETVTPEAGIEKLKKQLKDEQEARAAAEAHARESAQAEAKARERVQTTELDLVKNAITTVTQANDALESKYAEAMAAQDWAAAAKAQREMGVNSAKLVQLEAGKVQLEKQPKPAPRASGDPVEAFCAQLSAPSAAWVRAHPEYARDQSKNRQMIAAHEMALAKGHKADTEDYFKSVEKSLEVNQPRTNGHGNGAAEVDPLAEGASVATGGRQEAPAAAPVSRAATSANGSRPNIVRLSADEVEIAQNMGMTPEEYARNKIALKKEGKLS